MSSIRLTVLSVVLAAAYVGPSASWAAAGSRGGTSANDARLVSGTVAPHTPTAFRTALATLLGLALAGSLRRKPLYR